MGSGTWFRGRLSAIGVSSDQFLLVDPNQCSTTGITMAGVCCFCFYCCCFLFVLFLLLLFAFFFGGGVCLFFVGGFWGFFGGRGGGKIVFACLFLLWVVFLL